MAHTAIADQEITLSAVVTRCGCKCARQRARHAGQACPNPRAVEDRGDLAYWHPNPLRRIAWKLGRWLRGKRTGRITFHSKEHE